MHNIFASHFLSRIVFRLRVVRFRWRGQKSSANFANCENNQLHQPHSPPFITDQKWVEPLHLSFLEEKCEFLGVNFCRARELVVVSLSLFLPPSCQKFISEENLFLPRRPSDVKLRLSVATHFTSIQSLFRNPSKYGNSKCNIFLGQKLSDADFGVNCIKASQLCRPQEMRRCDRMQLRRKRRNSPNVLNCSHSDSIREWHSWHSQLPRCYSSAAE